MFYSAEPELDNSSLEELVSDFLNLFTFTQTHSKMSPVVGLAQGRDYSDSRSNLLIDSFINKWWKSVGINARKYNTGRSVLVQGFLVVIAKGTRPRNEVLDDVVRYCIGHTNSGNGDIH